jgi:hypothetical protein
VRRVLLDENLPRKLRRELVASVVRTVQEEGWTSFSNGELLGRAQTNFDVFLTPDRRLQFQQNLSRFDIGVVVILTVSLRFRDIRTVSESIRASIAVVSPGELIQRCRGHDGADRLSVPLGGARKQRHESYARVQRRAERSRPHR